MSNVSKSSSQWSPAPAANFSLILILFFTSRLMMLLAFPLEGLITYGDYQYFFNVADLSRSGGCALFTGSQQGCYPYIDYWYEYPPIFSYLNIALYILGQYQLKNYIFLLSFVLLLVECGNLYLLYRLALVLYNRTRAINIAWIYTALFIPIFFWLSNFDALTTFFILLGLYSLMKNKNKLLVLALSLGAMVKFLPIILIAAVWRSRGVRVAFLYGAATVFISLLIFGPFALLNSGFTLASLRAQAGKSSHQTIWAMIDGNATTGTFGPLINHFDATKAAEPVNNPARIPPWLTLIPFGLLGLFILTRPPTLSNPHLDTIVFTALTFVIFFLWAKTWSPQWQTFLIPLLLLALPEGRAILFIIVLGFVNFLEWPVILSRGLVELLPITIIIRTLLFGLLAYELYRKLVQTGKTDMIEQDSR